MDISSRTKWNSESKQNLSICSNRNQIKEQENNNKDISKTYTAAVNFASSIQSTQLRQTPQSKKQEIEKQIFSSLLSRKHVYNSKEITEILDLNTGKSEFKSKSTFKYVMDDYNEIVKMGENLLNVSPFSSNDYKQTEWYFLKTENKQDSNIKTESTMNIPKCDSKDQKFECLCRNCIPKMNTISKSQEYNKINPNFDLQCQSKTFEQSPKQRIETQEGKKIFCLSDTINQYQV